MDRLIPFNGDIETKNQLLNFIYAHIDSVAIEKMYKGDDVSHIKDAKELIDGAFDLLEETYGVTIKQDEPTNHAK